MVTISEYNEYTNMGSQRIRTFSTLCYLTWGSLFSWMALVCIAVALGTDYWEEVEVDRDTLEAFQPVILSPSDFTNEWIYFSRHRGLFRTCFPGPDTIFLEIDDSLDVVDNICIREQGFKLPTPSQYNGWGSDYDVRNHLLRFSVAMCVIAALLYLVTCFMAAGACYNTSYAFMSGAAIFCIIAATSAAIGVGVFVAVVYYEEKEVVQYPFYAYWNRLNPLGLHTEKRFHFSFYLAWCSAGLGVFGAILFAVAAWQRRRDGRRFTYQDKPRRVEHIHAPPPPSTMLPGPMFAAPPPVESMYAVAPPVEPIYALAPPLLDPMYAVSPQPILVPAAPSSYTVRSNPVLLAPVGPAFSNPSLYGGPIYG